MWSEIPSGLEYTDNMTSSFDVDTGRIVDQGQMQAEDGTIISTGSGKIHMAPNQSLWCRGRPVSTC